MNLKFNRSQTKHLIFLLNWFHSWLLLPLLISPRCSRQKSWSHWLLYFSLIPHSISKQILLTPPSESIYDPTTPRFCSANAWIQTTGMSHRNTAVLFMVGSSLLLLLYNPPHRQLLGESQTVFNNKNTCILFLCSELINVFTFCSE